MSIVIRDLTSEDREQWETLWAGYTDFYRASLSAEQTDLTFNRLCSGQEGMFSLVAENDQGELVGLAHGVAHRSTWREGWNCYLEDLFVDPECRGNDVAATLIQATKDRARELGSERLYWVTQPYNGPARSLYDRVGRLISRVVYESDV